MKKIHSIMAILLCMILVLPCRATYEQGEEFVWDKPKEALLAGLMETDIQSIQEAYKAGLLTCREVTAYYLERIATYNEPYNCFITLCEDALEQADEIDRRMASGDTDGLLFGIPIVIKDNMDYAGYHTTNGYDKRDNQIADSNAKIVDYLLQEGAVILGKTNMSTDAQDAKACYSQVAGETKNAYNRHLAAGASSGGSAVATSLNFAVLGLGTDTNASLRYPSVLNGCIALRVTWGSLPMDGIEALNTRRDVPGVITRTVLDQAIALDALSGGETSYAENLDGNVLKGLRLGIVRELTYPGGSENPEVIAAFDAAVKEFEACGAEVIEVSIPGVDGWNYITNDSEDYRQQRIAQLEEIMEENGISAWIFPSYLSAPQYSGVDENGKYWDTADQLFLSNTAKLSPNIGLPEIAIPIGYHSRGASIGMEITAGRNEEQLLLNIAYAYTTAYDHRQVPAEVEDLYAEWHEGTLAELCEEYDVALAQYIAEQTPTETEATEEVTEENPEETTEGRPRETTEAAPVPTEGTGGSQGSGKTELQAPRILYILSAVCIVPIFIKIIAVIIRKILTKDQPVDFY